MCYMPRLVYPLHPGKLTRMKPIQLCFTHAVCLMAIICAACTRQRAELGTSGNPIQFFLVPSVENALLEESAMAIKIHLETHTPYKFKMTVPNSYIVVVEAFGSQRTDVASLNLFGYALAHKKYGANAALTIVRQGETTYRSQILARAGGPIRSIKDLDGKRFAFVDPTSVSGYLLPLKLFKDNGVKPKDTVFAQRHDNVISMIYQGQVDGGATYYNPPIKGEIQDARRLVRTQYPDIEKKVVAVGFSEAVPNDLIVFRKDLPPAIANAVRGGLINFAQTAEGKKALELSFSVTGFKTTSDEEYKSARKLIDDLGK
jgi:phosphonate transport system substrate-binding protein